MEPLICSDYIKVTFEDKLLFFSFNSYLTKNVFCASSVTQIPARNDRWNIFIRHEMFLMSSLQNDSIVHKENLWPSGMNILTCSAVVVASWPLVNAEMITKVANKLARWIVHRRLLKAFIFTMSNHLKPHYLIRNTDQIFFTLKKNILFIPTLRYNTNHCFVQMHSILFFKCSPIEHKMFHKLNSINSPILQLINVELISIPVSCRPRND